MKALLASILAATLSSTTLAATISFPNNPSVGPDVLVNVNFVDTGFRFSPSCYLEGLYIITNFVDERCNDNYLGSGIPFPGQNFGALYIDFFGKPFSLTSVLPAQGGFVVRRHEIDVQSSKGGFFSFTEPETEMFFTGDEWRNITWLVIMNNFSDSPSQGAANFVVSIPEPATQALIAIALIGLAFSRRRKQ